MKKIQFFALIFAISMVFASCSESTKRVERSFGGTSEILLVTQNDDQWDGQIGEAVREYFEEYQYGLPQPEKTFKVAHININAFDDMFKKYRNIIIAEINSELQNPIVEEQVDWKAAPQYVMKIKAKDRATWVNAFNSNKDDLKKKFEKNERARLLNFFRPDANVEAMEELKKTYGFTMIIPKGYYIAINQDDFTWIRKEEKDKSLGLIIYQLPYTSTNDLSEERIMAKTDSVTKKYIFGDAEGSYMELDKKFVKPVFKAVPDFTAGFAVEMRGQWSTVGDYMGGPYVSYTIVNPEANKLVCIEGFIYYPNKDKRDLLRQLESIIWSLKFQLLTDL